MKPLLTGSCRNRRRRVGGRLVRLEEGSAGAGARMKRAVLRVCVFLWASLQRGDARVAAPAAELDCCEGDIVLLLDSSGSVANYEFLRLLLFAAEVLRPFSLGRGRVRVALLQVGTHPNLEFGLDVHAEQESLQKAMRSVTQLQGDTNTEAALRQAQQLLTATNVPKVLLWLTDGVQPGQVEEPMSELKEQGVSVLAVSTVHGNFHLLKRAVTPPVESHLYSVDIDNTDLITEAVREAIIKIIDAKRLRVVRLTSHSAVLQWRPVLSAGSGHYELRCSTKENADTETRRFLPGDSSWVELTDLQPGTTYAASLRPESDQRLLNTLLVDFTTLPDVLCPAVVSVSDSGPHRIRVSWGPLQPAQVQRHVVEYGAIPSGQVQTVTLHSHRNSTLLTNLAPATEYLITVSAVYRDGKESAMSVRACTQEAALPALTSLRLTSVERREVVVWQPITSHKDLRGYWLSWKRENPNGSSAPSLFSVYLPPSSHSTQLTHLTRSSRVCVSPVYSSGRGGGICCTAERQSCLSRPLKPASPTYSTMEEDVDTELVGMGLRVSVSHGQTAIYIILVLLGILGNAIVIGVIGKSVIMDRSGGRNSDIIIINMAFSNLLVSVMRNMLLVISDMGLELYSSKEWCQFLMGVWVWLRSVNVWSTLFLSAFHLQTLRRVTPTGNLRGLRGAPRTLLLSLSLIWFLNFIYSIPAHIFSTSGNVNSTETLMLVSSTTRPLLGCVWNFPSSSGLAYATTSMVIHETIPIILMAFTNLCSLYTLYMHGRVRSSSQDMPVIKRVPAERRAAKVILALIMLFIASWGTSIISVNYFNYNRGPSAEFLLVIARFANIIFIAMSPAVLAVGHRRLRSFFKSAMSH